MHYNKQVVKTILEETLFYYVPINVSAVFLQNNYLIISEDVYRQFYAESSEAERVHFPYMGEAVRATKRTGTNFAGKES